MLLKIWWCYSACVLFHFPPFWARCFNQASVEDILEALDKEGTEWARKQLEVRSIVDLCYCIASCINYWGEVPELIFGKNIWKIDISEYQLIHMLCLIVIAPVYLHTYASITNWIVTYWQLSTRVYANLFLLFIIQNEPVVNAYTCIYSGCLQFWKIQVHCIKTVSACMGAYELQLLLNSFIFILPI